MGPRQLSSTAQETFISSHMVHSTAHDTHQRFTLDAGRGHPGCLQAGNAKPPPTEMGRPQLFSKVPPWGHHHCTGHISCPHMLPPQRGQHHTGRCFSLSPLAQYKSLSAAREESRVLTSTVTLGRYPKYASRVLPKLSGLLRLRII